MFAQVKALADIMTQNAAKAQSEPLQEAPAAPVSAQEEVPPPPSPLPIPLSLSPALSQNLKNTRNLLVALKPFLDDKRCAKIDKMLSMMRLAEMAGQFGNLF